MALDDVWRWLRERIFSAASTATLFNQYNGRDLKANIPESGRIRRGNLLNYLRSFPERPTFLLIGEAAGWRGCRFSGVPFTSEAQLCNDALPFSGQQSSSGRPHRETTASVFWRVLFPYHPLFFAWNSIPFHPHEPGEPLSNRTPTRREIAAHAGLLSELVSLLKPTCTIAVGRSAESALNRIGAPSFYVRHPAHGGAKAFRTGIARGMSLLLKSE
jgi:uracil-DNA glycosylase